MDNERDQIMHEIPLSSLDYYQELEAKVERLQSKIKRAMQLEGYYHESGAGFGDYERGRADGWEAARREFHKRLSED